MEATQVDLSKFCYQGEGRFDMSQPFVRGGYLYATDGRVCVRMETSEADTPSGQRPFPKLEQVFDGFDKPEWNDWPEVDYTHADKSCEACDGVGRVDQEQCPECDGHGESECQHCLNVAECKGCDGSGKTGGKRCPDCKGKKHYIQPSTQPVGRFKIQAKYDRLIRALPGPVSFGCFADEKDERIAFRFAGGDGVVMPLRT